MRSHTKRFRRYLSRAVHVRTVFILVSSTACAISAYARNVDLSTVPRRDTVQLTIYNSEDLTLVRETRRITFKKGLNGLQFSWANTLIDPTSVELRFLAHADRLELLDTTFPHDKPQMLSWNIISEMDGDATVEITYFTSGITWSADYILTSDQAEKKLRLEGYVRVTNNSGEDYEQAEIRLVVGTINLVEKIAELAQLGIDSVRGLAKEESARFRRQAARSMMEDRSTARLDYPRSEPETMAPKEIIKEGLSEYFIFTIPGHETIPDGWAKRLRAIGSSPFFPVNVSMVHAS